jgi:hypothetical protein
MTACVFVGVEREFGTLLHLPPIAPPRFSTPSLRHVSYAASQLPMTAVGTMFIFSMKDSHPPLSIVSSFLWFTDAHTNTIEATWKQVNIHLRLY